MVSPSGEQIYTFRHTIASRYKQKHSTGNLQDRPFGDPSRLLSQPPEFRGPWIPLGSMGWSGQDSNSKDWDLDNWPSGKNSGPRGYMRLDARVPLLPVINQTVEGKSRNGKKTRKIIVLGHF